MDLSSYFEFDETKVFVIHEKPRRPYNVRSMKSLVRFVTIIIQLSSNKFYVLLGFMDSHKTVFRSIHIMISFRLG